MHIYLETVLPKMYHSLGFVGHSSAVALVRKAAQTNVCKRLQKMSPTYKRHHVHTQTLKWHFLKIFTAESFH